MKDLKLTIDLLPKGAWGNDLSKTLSSKDWDILRDYCYKRYKYKCAICGEQSDKLNAHEEWDFDIVNKTQTLKNIIALCPKCHGVKHMKNSERLGYGENAKRHFMTINNATEIEFANHYSHALLLFEERNNIYRWKIVADLSNFGGSEIKYKQKIIPLIETVYNNEELQILKNEISYKPRVINIDIDNYAGKLTILCDRVNKIEWFNNGNLLHTKFNFCRILKTSLSVANLSGNISFKLTGSKGEFLSKAFRLQN